MTDEKNNGALGAFSEVSETGGVEEQYRLLFENATHGIYRTTPDGRILLANPALIAMLGYDSFEELAQRNLEAEGMGLAYARSEFKARLDSEGEVRGLEAIWHRRDGSMVFVRENARVVWDTDHTWHSFTPALSKTSRIINWQKKPCGGARRVSREMPPTCRA